MPVVLFVICMSTSQLNIRTASFAAGSASILFNDLSIAGPVFPGTSKKEIVVPGKSLSVRPGIAAGAADAAGTTLVAVAGGAGRVDEGRRVAGAGRAVGAEP